MKQKKTFHYFKKVIIGLFLINTVTINGNIEISNIIPSKINISDYIFIIDINKQKNYLYYKNTLIDTFNISTGSKDRYSGNRELSEGLWRLNGKLDQAEINKIFKDNADIYGPRLIYLEKYNIKKQMFVKTNKAFHGTNEPENIGKPTSMGCVYHLNQDIKNIYSYIPNNTIVISLKSIWIKK